MFITSISQLRAFLQLLLYKRGYFYYNGYKILVTNFNALGIFQKNKLEVHGARQIIYKKLDLFIDVGSHIGLKSFFFKLENQNAKVVAFEPNPYAYKILERNLSSFKNIQIFKAGIGDKKGILNLNIDRDHFDTASFNIVDSYVKKNLITGMKLIKEKVPVNTLDSFLPYFMKYKNIFLKIDVESFERKVLKGGKKILKFCKYLEIEIRQTDKLLFSDISRILHGYKYNIIEIDTLKVDKNGIAVLNLLIEFL